MNGSGIIDGQGYDWWVDVILQQHEHGRPNLIQFEVSTNLIILNLTFQNSPAWHVNLWDMENIYIAGVTIYTDAEQQAKLVADAGYTIKDLPTFPLNTDGFDIAAVNVLIENVTITNYDDAVAVKPCHQEYTYCKCSSNMVIQNANVIYGVGMSIGSVPPHQGGACVRNITFDQINFSKPYKAIYIKSNPGTIGTGLIEQITYSNILADAPQWYGLWIGPQQQQQPGTAGTGCSFLYPLKGSDCPTQPLITIRDIAIVNVTFTNGYMMPGVIQCDPTNPCTNITFDNVQTSGDFVFEKHYICNNAKGTSSNSNLVPDCLV